MASNDDENEGRTANYSRCQHDDEIESDFDDDNNNNEKEETVTIASSNNNNSNYMNDGNNKKHSTTTNTNNDNNNNNNNYSNDGRNNNNNNNKQTYIKMKRKMKSRSQRKRNRRLREANEISTGDRNKNNHHHDPMKSLQSNTVQLQDALLQTKVVRLCLPITPPVAEQQSTTRIDDDNEQDNNMDLSKNITNDTNSNNNDTNQSIEIPNGPWIRVIEPYPYAFTSNVKGRWVGRSILDVYTTEFGSYPPSYYATAIQQGRIRVSNKIVETTYIIQGNDTLTHSVHRHEPAVAVSYNYSPEMGDTTTTTPTNENQSLISIVANTDQVLAVDKPSTMPVHPCGGYYQNTLISILENMKTDDGRTLLYGKLHTIHRLDRLTSGLVILAKSSSVATEWGKAIQHRDQCEKLYVTRVRGKFISDLLNNNNSIRITPIENNRPSDETRSGKQKHEIPYHGEWDYNDKKQSIKSNSLEENATIARKRNALGYWITDLNNNIRNDVSIEEFSSIYHTIDEWMDVLKQTLSSSSNNIKKSSNSSADVDPRYKSFLWLNMACPVRIEQHKNGVCAAGSFDDLDNEAFVKTVKPAETAFAIVKYNDHDNTTVLLARPKTGRTHQIRIHLQYINYPIANDPNYGGALWFGNPIGEQACQQAKQILTATFSNDDDDNDVNMMSVNCIRQEVDSSTFTSTTTTITEDHARVIADEPATENEINRILQLPQGDDETFHDFICRTCVWCARMQQGGRYTKEQRDHLEFLVRSPGLWLHALQYTIKGTSFRTTIPTWSQ